MTNPGGLTKQFDGPLPEAVDVVVIGAGVAGTASAYFLARRGVKVLLAEKGVVAAEQSSRNWGWVRQQGRDWAELPIMMEANRIWRGLAEETGEDGLTFIEAGNVTLIADQAGLARAEAFRELSMRHQLETRILSREETAQRFGGVGGDWIAAMETPSDGRGEPFAAVPALARAARNAGAVVIEDCAVRTVDLAGGRVAGVVTEKGRVRCERVLLAGGAWSTHFAHNAGVDLPQLAVRSTVARTEPAPDAYANNFATPGLYLRRRADGGYSVSSGDLAEHYISRASFRYLTKFTKLLKVSAKDVKLHLAAPKGYPGAWGAPTRWSADDVSPFERMRILNPDPSPIVVRRIEERLPQRFPALQGVRLAQAWAGMIDVTPDAVPTLGESTEVPGLYIATGLSGHGFGIGPAVGRIMADVMSGRDSGHDINRFRPNRFFDGSPIEPGPY